MPEFTNADDEIKGLLQSLCLIMAQALATAFAVRQALEESSPELKALIEKQYAALEAGPMASLNDLFGQSVDERFLSVLRKFSSNSIQ